MNKVKQKAMLLVAIAIMVVTVTSVVAYAAWHTTAVKNTGNTITTGAAVSYTLTGDVDADGVMPGDVVAQELVIGGIEEGTSTKLEVINMVATDGEGEVVAGIAEYLTYELFDAEDEPVDMEDISDDGTYTLKFTLDAGTPDTFAECIITYTLTLTKNVA